MHGSRKEAVGEGVNVGYYTTKVCRMALEEAGKWVFSLVSKS